MRFAYSESAAYKISTIKLCQLLRQQTVNMPPPGENKTPPSHTLIYGIKKKAPPLRLEHNLSWTTEMLYFPRIVLKTAVIIMFQKQNIQVWYIVRNVQKVCKDFI